MDLGEDEDDMMDDEAAMITRDMMPEITKLNLLNHFLGVEALPAFDKIHLIYEKILEEVRGVYSRIFDNYYYYYYYS